MAFYNQVTLFINLRTAIAPPIFNHKHTIANETPLNNEY